jgi:diguanylate cyclase (GGDEF)-like protein/PAS domain S-box-containing protein
MKKMKSLNSAYKSSFIILPVIIGIFFVIFQIFYEINTSESKIRTETGNYEAAIKNRMEEEVNNAIYLSNYYYTTNKGKLSDDEIKKAIIEMLENLQSEDIGYFFAADFNGNTMIGPNKGKNTYNIEDKNGLKVVQELINSAKAGGGYIKYVMPPIEGVEQDPKISYVMPFEPYQWYIGAGVPLSQIETIQTQIRQDMIAKNIYSILMISFLIMLVVALLGFINSRLYKKIQHDIIHIYHYLENSKDENCQPETTQFSFIELNEIQTYATNLVIKRDEDGKKLSEQFQELKRVAGELEEINASLEEEIGDHAKSLEYLNISQKRFESIVNMLPDVIFIIDRNGIFVDCESGDKPWLLLEKEKFIGQSIALILPDDIYQRSMEKIELALETDEMQLFDYELNYNDAVSYYEVRFIKFQENEVFAILRNVTELKKSQLNNEYLSYHDQLTGIFNRRYFEEQLIRLDSEQHLPLAIAMVDVNGLKLTNDAFGHQTGDELLKYIANLLLEQSCSKNDFVARIGGDEFAIVYPNTGDAEVETRIRNIYNKLNEEQTNHFIISVSIGWASKKSCDQSLSEIFNIAEGHMYRKKLTESQSMRNQTVQAIMKTLNEKNAREKIHLERVSSICRLIGEALNLDYETIKEIETAGLLHDIGKIVIDEKILNKEGRLTEDEYLVIKKHPESSYQILKSIDAYVGLAEAVLSHHERWDGNGYPRGLKGEEISLVARIITIADSYEAMTADRSYRAAMSKEYAMEELKKYSGIQFDGNIVAVFEREVLHKL